MSSERWTRIEELFNAALEREPGERLSFLQGRCPDDPALRAEVQSLLAEHERGSSFLEEPAFERTGGSLLESRRVGPGPASSDGSSADVALSAAGGRAEARPAAALPTDIGPYRILREIGRGGMGVVYEAEQRQPRRLVALKVTGRYVDEHARKLFLREEQALARLKHPGIGAIYEAGCTDEGRQFFAMELVSGEPLTQYAQSRKLPVRGRLELFCKVCEAVNYAHQRGVIHRDLKPSNILVDDDTDRSREREPAVGSDPSAQAQTARPKVLDFGLARITDSDVAAATLTTELGRIQGTLAYMSPEQAGGNPQEIDLRSDVYSLGVVLYELLTDRLPYDVRQTGLGGLPEADQGCA